MDHPLESAAPPSPRAEDRVDDRALELVRRVFGFESLRPMQAAAIDAGTKNRDALVVMPTGGGKSLCFQVPALLREGLTVVVSPLISLMQDQVIGLREVGIEARMLTSAQEPSDRREAEASVARGETKILYVAPERLMSEGFLNWLDQNGLVSIAIDEAHCISHWGHDFRPEYRMLGELRTARPHLAVQAFTATATPEVRADIVKALGLRDPVLLVGGFDRPNLSYRIQPRRDLVNQVHAVIERHSKRAGIVYCLRRLDVEKLASELSGLGVRCAPYHAGLSGAVRTKTQEKFLNEDLDVVVATVAFGMGIDRSDVRFVVHASLPKGLEQYSQETGRAGRDGMPAECVLFYGGADFHGWKNLMEMSAREAVAEGAPNAGADLDNSLERLSHVWSFATGARCRHKTLCEYFGQSFACPPAGCGACDVCLGEIATVADSKIVAQKILSCVVRCEQRYGAQHVTDVLRGANTAKLRQTGHDRLSTFGLLSQHTNQEVRTWIDQLVGLGHLRVADGDYPTLFLSKSGVDVMRGDMQVTLYSPTPPKSKSRERASAREPLALEGDVQPDPVLFERLRDLRRSIAKERNIPPYLVFNDKTLALMAAQRPVTDEGFRGIKGVGDKKAVDLGPAFLEAIATYLQSAQ
ncbi:MAG: DNA helicase RecQ [Planctomycetota bacterium]|nr:DNA helicase RecQ [Planctomycetota bacterium]